MSASPIQTYLGRNNTLLEDDSLARAEMIHYEGYLTRDFIETCARELEARGYLALAKAPRVYEYFSYRRAYTYDIVDANGHVFLLEATPATGTWELVINDREPRIKGPLSALAA